VADSFAAGTRLQQDFAGELEIRVSSLELLDKTVTAIPDSARDPYSSAVQDLCSRLQAAIAGTSREDQSVAAALLRFPTVKRCTQP
jgi:hypothetical protein